MEGKSVADLTGHCESWARVGKYKKPSRGEGLGSKGFIQQKARTL